MKLSAAPPLYFSLTLALILPMFSTPATAQQNQPAADSGVFVSEGTLDAYVGTYVISPGFEIKVWREGDHLMLQATGQAAWPLQGMSETVFHVQAMDAKVTFGENAAGNTDHLVLLVDGRETKALRK